MFMMSYHMTIQGEVPEGDIFSFFPNHPPHTVEQHRSENPESYFRKVLEKPKIYIFYVDVEHIWFCLVV